MLPGRYATVRWQIWQRVTGRWVTVTGKRRERELLIVSIVPPVPECLAHRQAHPWRRMRMRGCSAARHRGSRLLHHALDLRDDAWRGRMLPGLSRVRCWARRSDDGFAGHVNQVGRLAVQVSVAAELRLFLKPAYRTGPVRVG